MEKIFVTKATMEVCGPPTIFYHVYAGRARPYCDQLNSGSKHLSAAKSLYSRYVNRGTAAYVEMRVREIYPVAPNGSRNETLTPMCATDVPVQPV